jgi:transglutaminase-like putative cysteine protease
VQVFVPGPGWVDFDPSGGVVGNRNLVRVAVAHQAKLLIVQCRTLAMTP